MPTQNVALEFFMWCILIIQFHVKKRSNAITDNFDRKIEYLKTE